MDTYILKLFPDGKEPQELVLREHRIETSILDMVNTSPSYVFCDSKYRGAIICDSDTEISNFQIFINGSSVNVSFFPDNNSIQFNDFSFGQRIFSECYGFVQIAVSFDTPEESLFLESEYVQVMVRKGRQNDSVRRMVEYVYNHNSSLLYGRNVLSKDSANLNNGFYRTLESRILLLKQMSIVFDELYRYFRANSRFTTVPHEYVDNFERLQYVSGRSIQYMIQHPEELFQISSNLGIRINNRSYQPNKTLITNSVCSVDIYENRCIIGFLKTIIDDIVTIESELRDVVSGAPNGPREVDDYVTSSYFIYINTVERLKIVLNDVRYLHQKYHDLFSAYSNILNVSEVIVKTIPRPTHIFLSVPQYRQIYDQMVSWFTMGAFTLESQKYMLSFLKVSSLYEVYVLTKIIEFFRNSEYELVSIEKKRYTFSGKALYENTSCNNYFVFEKGDNRITLYYQPVIYSIDKRSISGVGLYRNTSIPFPRYIGDYYPGSYYAPDFLVKYESESFSDVKYLIADAKFSTVKNIKEYQIAPLVYKYLFSISPIDKKDSVVALCIVNGQSDKDLDTITHIYDFSDDPDNITPNANILTMTENSENCSELHFSLLKKVLGKYL